MRTSKHTFPRKPQLLAGAMPARGGPLRAPGRRPQGLASTLFGRTRQAVFRLLFGHPAEAFYVRAIARATGVSVGTVQRELTQLVGAGILERSVKGRQVYYQADRRCPIFEELRSIVAKTSGRRAASVVVGDVTLGEAVDALAGTEDDDVLVRLGAARVAGSAHHEPTGDRRSAHAGAARPRRQPHPRRQR